MIEGGCLECRVVHDWRGGGGVWSTGWSMIEGLQEWSMIEGLQEWSMIDGVSRLQIIGSLHSTHTFSLHCDYV